MKIKQLLTQLKNFYIFHILIDKCDKRPSQKYRNIISKKIDFLADRLKDRMVFHVAAPKSGSSWLDTILINTKAYEVNTLVPDYSRREQEICLDIFPCFRRSLFNNKKFYIPHHHTVASEFTIQVIEKLNMKVILQVRNIFDTVFSMQDHIINESHILAMAYIPHDFYKLDQEKQIDMIIDLVIPWYIKFYASWFEYLKTEKKYIYILPYEDLKNNTLSELNKVINFLEIDNLQHKDLEKIVEDIKNQPNKTRKNKGIVGRGNSLSTLQKEKIIKLTSYYNIDFSLIGIPEETMK